MRMTRPVNWLCGVLLLAIGIQPARAADTPPSSDSLVSRLPKGAIGTLEFANLAPVIERIETSPVLQAVLDSPQWREAMKQNQVQQALAGKALAEGQLGMSLWQFAKTYLGDRSVVGVYPPSQPGGPPDGVVIIQVKQAESLKTLWERVSPFIPLAGSKLKASDYEGGGRLITVDDGHQLVIRDRWIVLSKVKSLLEQTLQNLAVAPPDETTLFGSPAWKLMAAQLGTDHEIQLCVDTALVNSLVGHRIIPAKLDNPVFSLLLGGYLELAASSPHFASTFDVKSNHVQLRTAVAGDARQLDAAHRSFVLEGDAVPRAAVPMLKTPLNGFSITRDFGAWYRNREALLDAKLMPGFDKFETGLATFLSGRDFSEDVLPLLGKRLTFVTAPQTFAHLQGKPGVQLPGFGIVLDLAKPAEANDLLTLFFQTAVNISNFDAGKQGRQLFVLSSESYHDIQVSFAKFLTQPAGDTLPISANFQPAIARVGNRFLATTNLELCRQLIDSLQAEATANPVATSSVRTEGFRDIYFDLSPEIAADLLERNASVLQAQSLQQGESADQATGELNALLALLRQLTPMTFTSTRLTDRWELEFQAGWK